MRATETPAGGSTAQPIPDDDLDPKIHARRWFTLATLCLSLLIIVMDNTILNVAIPSLMSELGASNSQVQWILDSYILVFAGLLLTTGTLSDRFGRKGALQLGIVWFALGSTAAALSTTAAQLIAARAFMGVGGALIMPATLSILTNVFRDPRERARAIAIWAGFAGLGVAVGPMTGGFLLSHFSWSSVFWINLPIGATALIAGLWLVPTSRDPDHRKLDPLGAVLSIVGLVSLIFGIIEGPVHGWSDPRVIIGFTTGVVVLALFVLWELHTPNPMLPMSFWRNPRFSTANAAITLTFFAMFGSLFLMTQYWQLVQGYTPLQAGVRVVPYAIVMMVGAPLSARVVERVGTKLVMTTGLLIIATALASMSFLTAHTEYWKAIALFCVMAVGMSMTMAPATESIMGSLPRSRAGVGSALNDTTRQVGGALGVAVIGSVVSSVYTNRIDDGAAAFGLTGEPLARAEESLGGALEAAEGLGGQAAEFVEMARVSFVGALSNGLRFSAAVICLAALVVWRFLPARGVPVAEDVVESSPRPATPAPAASTRRPAAAPGNPLPGVAGATGGD